MSVNPPSPDSWRPKPRWSLRDLDERAKKWLAYLGWHRIVFSAMFLIVLALVGAWLFHTPRQPVEQSIPFASPSTNPPSSKLAVVYVTGAVSKPGIYSLKTSARLFEAIFLAGGFADDADQTAINLAAQVVDGVQIFVPRIGEAPRLIQPGSSSVGTGKVSLNSASSAELEQLPGIGPATAAAIIKWREDNGPFTSVDELLEVTGIGDSKLDAIRELISL
jgi:competence protein ComEA